MTSADELMRAVVEERALQRLTESYARAADRRDSAGAAALFTEDGTLTVSLEGGAESQRHRGRDEIAAAIASALRPFDVTTHFLGQRGFAVDGEQASGETYCLAYHVRRRPGRTVTVLLAIRYLDTCVRRDGRWLFSERVLVTDWTDRWERAGGSP